MLVEWDLLLAIFQQVREIHGSNRFCIYFLYYQSSLLLYTSSIVL